MSLISMIFRAWLAGRIGADGMGLYQLVLSVSFLASTLAISGIRFAATRLISEELGFGRDGDAAMGRCFAYSLFFGISAGLVLYLCAEPAGFLLIGDARTVLALKISAFSMPLVSLCAVFSGYFTACGRVWKPSLVHLAEQLTTVFLVALFLSEANGVDIEACCAGISRGTVCGDCIALLLLLGFYLTDRGRQSAASPAAGYTRRLLSIALPLAISAYARSALSMIQHILVPRGLKASGLRAERALAAYGTLSAMALPVIFFPSCIIGALAELMVPELTAAQVKGSRTAISRITKDATRNGIGYSVAVALIMFTFAEPLGLAVYSSPEAGYYIRLLAPLVPVMYTDMLIDGCLKGLGQQVWSMGINILDALLGVILTWQLLPLYAMDAYVGIIYFTECLNFALSAWRLNKAIRIT